MKRLKKIFFLNFVSPESYTFAKLIPPSLLLVGMPTRHLLAKKELVKPEYSTQTFSSSYCIDKELFLFIKTHEGNQYGTRDTEKDLPVP